MAEGVLTIEILRDAVAKIKTFEYKNEVVGFKVNPADLRDIEDGKASYCGIINGSFIMMPPYQGLKLVPDVNQPRGYVKPIRREIDAIKQRR